MIVNEKLNSLYNSNNRDLNAYILINGAKKISSTDLLKDFKLNQKIDIDGIWIGQAIPKLLELTIIKKELNYTLEKNQKVDIFHEIKDELEVFQYSKLGTFYIREIEDKEDSETIKLICYDDLKKLQDMDIPTLTYPLSVNNLLKKVMEKTGILYDTTNLINLNFNISKEIYFGNNPKVVDVIRAIAQANLCYAYIDTITNKLKFGRLKNVNTQISDDVTFRLKVKDIQKTYNSVVISRTPQEDNVYNRLPGSNENNLVELKIENNPILDLDRENFAASLLNIAKTITYEGTEDFVILSNPLIEVGDIVTIRNHNIAILEQTITLTRNDIKSVIAKKTNTDYMKAKSLEKLKKDTELYVDKIKGEIVARVSDEVDGRLAELKITDNEITNKVTNTVTSKLSDPEFIKQFKGEKGDKGADADVSKLVTKSVFESYQSTTDRAITQRVTRTDYDKNNREIQKSVGEAKLYIDNQLSNFKVTADRIKLEGYTTINGGFSVDTEGSMTARSGRIGGFNIKDGTLESISTGSYVRISGDPKLNPIAIGPSSDYSKWNFLVQNDGTATLKNANIAGEIYAHTGRIGGFEIKDSILESETSNSYVRISGKAELNPIVVGPSKDFSQWKFVVATDGAVTARDVDIAGKITAHSGLIGGFNIIDTTLESINSGSYVRISGKSGLSPIVVGPSKDWTSWKFTVSTDGKLVAKEAEITGTITARSGRIGGFTIENNWIIGANGFRLSGSSGYQMLQSSNTTINANGSITSSYGSYSGSSYGHGSFSSGSYTGSVYAGSGTLAGTPFSNQEGTVYFSKIGAGQVNTAKIVGDYDTVTGGYHTAVLSRTGWKISNSDIRLKENIEDLGDEFNQYIYDMPLIKYTYIADETHNPQIGVNANYLMKILPEYMAKSFLHQDKNTGLYGAKYELLTPLAIKAIQDLNKRLERLENGKDS